MFWVVNQLRRAGKKLLPDAVRAHPIPGYLVMDRREITPETDGKLFDRQGSTKETAPASKISRSAVNHTV